MADAPPIHVFWHIYVNDKRTARCKSIIERQYSKLSASGLLDAVSRVHIGYVSKTQFPCPHILNNPKVVLAVHEAAGHEGVTTAHLKQYCDALPHDVYVLYMHTRGATRQPDTPAEDWTLMLEYFVIERWKRAITVLIDHLTCGCEMWSHRHRVRQNDFSYHYSGNFWWARSEYIKLLPPPSYETRHMESEDWILQLAGRQHDRTRFGVLHRTADKLYERGVINSYVHRYPFECYESGSETPDVDVRALVSQRPV
jgi:hypothetical protein